MYTLHTISVDRTWVTRTTQIRCSNCGIKTGAAVRLDGNTAAHEHSDRCDGSFCFSCERSVTLAKSVVMESLLYSHGWEGLLDDSLLVKVACAL